ncbi:hypothetical protein CKAH01_19141 [Colletotrichum kahawae]|uniref:Uncharacterized protein n=1 Tax=Colletotrichum kahawae TaxID=34407 RepID=A0AAD9XYR8_COLKA|nr:hypothetical protein CKAH01_19141 [Colletotrichum kahawae]
MMRPSANMMILKPSVGKMTLTELSTKMMTSI